MYLSQIVCVLLLYVTIESVVLLILAALSSFSAVAGSTNITNTIEQLGQHSGILCLYKVFLITSWPCNDGC